MQGHRVHASYLFPDATIDSHTKRDDIREPLGLSYSSMSLCDAAVCGQSSVGRKLNPSSPPCAFFCTINAA
ncbi:hypothetical protein IG631_10817 [Alternaria alternata]|nr:hypothetical protein IG631_10817 [Alternaria alternata]